MKYSILIVISLLFISPISASFPVKRNKENKSVELVANIVNSTIDDSTSINPLTNIIADKFDIGGFLLGLVLGLVGVALAYLFSKDKVFIKSAWWGVGVWVILFVLILAAAAATTAAVASTY